MNITDELMDLRNNAIVLAVISAPFVMAFLFLAILF